MFSKRVPISYRLAVAAVIAILALSGCGSQGARNASTDESLTIAVEADVRDIASYMTSATTDRLIMGSTVYDPLFATSADGTPEPALATEASVTANPDVWLFEIRDGVTFQNGTPLTADIVVANLEKILDPETASPLLDGLGNIASVRATGPLTVEMTTTVPESQLQYAFTDQVFMSDPASWEQDVPVGTGPYQWDTRTPGDRIEFTPFDGYWRGTPPLQRVIFKVVEDPQVAQIQLQSGEVDVLPNNISADSIEQLRSDPNLNVYQTQGSAMYQAFLNFNKADRGGYADAAAFREGMAYLWNVEEIVPPIIGEYGEVSTQPVPPWMAGYDDAIQPWPYDPEKGKALLAKAGVNEGDEISLLVFNRPYTCDHGTAFQSHLNELGYNATLTCLEPEAAFDTIKQYNWDLLFARATAKLTTAQTLNQRFRSNVAEAADDFYTLKDPTLDAMIDELLGESDPQAYDSLASEALTRLLKEDIATLPAYVDNVFVAANKRVQGLEPSVLGYYGMLMNAYTTVTLDGSQA